MTTQFGYELGEIYPQPGFTVTRGDQGGWTASGEYEMSRATWDQPETRSKFSRRASITQIDPSIESFYQFLVLESVNVISDVADTITARVEYSGSIVDQYQGDNTDTLAPDVEFTTRLEIRERQESILTSKSFTNLSVDEQGLIGLMLAGSLVYLAVSDQDPRLLYFPPSGNESDLEDFIPIEQQLSTPAAMDFAERISRGETTRIVHSVNWVVSSDGIGRITAAQLGRLNQARTPPGNPPTPSDHDWKFIGATQEERGELIRTTLEYELSPPGGWPEILE